MTWGIRAFALVVVLLAAGCARSDDEIAALRQAVEAEMATAPLPAGASLVRGQFDKGCHDFFECADGPDRAAVHEADLYLGRPLAGAASECVYFVEMLRGKGFQLVGTWDKAQFKVDEAACAAGHPGSGTVVRADGRSFSDKASLKFSLLDDDRVAPRYVLTYEPHAPVVLSEVRLTPSVVAHIRGALDRPFVLSAGPQVDGITSGQTLRGQWRVAASTTSLRFEVTCDERDEVLLEAHDPNITGQSYEWGKRAVPCTGAATVADMPVALKKDEVWVTARAYGRPSAPRQEPSRHGDYVVRFVSAG